MYQTGGLIETADYNYFVNSINGILATGSGSSGYGQTTPLSNVTTDTVVLASQWNSLFSTMSKLSQHQGTSLAGAAWPVSVSSSDFVSAYNYTVQQGSGTLLPIGTAIGNLVANKDKIVSTNLTNTRKATASRTKSWDGQLYSEFLVTFPNYDSARYFFNLGGSIRVSSVMTNPINAASTNMQSLIASVGQVPLCGTLVPSDLSITVNNKFYQLTTSFVNIYTKSLGTATATIQARLETVTNANDSIRIRYTYTDADSSSIIGGNLFCYADESRSTGVFVAPGPSYSIPNNMVGSNAINPTFTISGATSATTGNTASGNVTITFAPEYINYEQVVADGVTTTLASTGSTSFGTSYGTYTFTKNTSTSRTWSYVPNNNAGNTTRQFIYRLIDLDGDIISQTWSIAVTPSTVVAYITGNVNNVNVSSYFNATDRTTKTCILVINGGVTVSSVASVYVALTVDQPFYNLGIWNNGSIIGVGGPGGASVATSYTAGNPGGAGGHAIYIAASSGTYSILNNGNIWGGGGGGGSGGCALMSTYSYATGSIKQGTYGQSGAGGNGAGLGAATAGAQGVDWQAGNGKNGPTQWWYAGDGGNGGGFGTAGAPGTMGYVQNYSVTAAGGAGGPAGYAILGYGKLGGLTNNGSILGPLG